MAPLQKSVMTVAILAMILVVASYPAFVNAKPTELQANPMYVIRDAVNPYAIGPDNPYFTPSDIKEAYGLPTTGGSGTTIAIVDAYGDPDIASNLATFSSEWGLPSANLVIHAMSSDVPSNYGWGMEESLDVEWAHAIAPLATILLVEASSSSTTDLLKAVSYAASQPGVVAVSMSWGTNEFSGEQTYDSYFTSSTGISFFASAGDNGGVVTWPSASANVISVGGTTLTQTSTGYTESAWSSGGGGVSAYEPAPSYQTQASLGYSMRATPDVAYDANPNTGFLVYDTYVYSGWYAVGGTSAGAPQWAAIQSLGLSATNQNFYKDYQTSYATYFKDITAGSNGYAAKVGYDLATGLGTPKTVNFATVTTPNFSLSASPSALTIQAGTSAQTTLTANSINQYTGTVQLSETDSYDWISYSPSSIIVPTSGSGTSKLTITVPSAAKAGTYSLTTQAIDANGLSHSTTVTVTVTTQDFSISTSPPSLSIPSGSHSTATITVTALNGFSGTVGLTVSAGSLKATLNPTSITTSTQGSSTLMVSIPSTVRSGTFTVTVTGTSGTLTHSASVAVRVGRS